MNAKAKETKKGKYVWLAEGGLMIALSIVLEILSKLIFPEMPYGGQVTFAAMLPVILVGWKYGIGKGLITGVSYALVEMVLGISTISKMVLPSSEDYLGSVWKIIAMILLDYLLAFTVLGLGGMYRKVIKNNATSLALGTFTVITLRYLCHVTSGYILFGGWAEWFFSTVSWGEGILEKYSGNLLSFIYSLIYNATYMLPEAIITTAVAVIVGNIPQLRSLGKKDKQEQKPEQKPEQKQ